MLQGQADEASGRRRRLCDRWCIAEAPIFTGGVPLRHQPHEASCRGPRRLGLPAGVVNGARRLPRRIMSARLAPSGTPSVMLAPRKSPAVHIEAARRLLDDADFLREWPGDRRNAASPPMPSAAFLRRRRSSRRSAVWRISCFTLASGGLGRCAVGHLPPASVVPLAHRLRHWRSLRCD